jgi:hypothetical protein
MSFERPARDGCRRRRRAVPQTSDRRKSGSASARFDGDVDRSTAGSLFAQAEGAATGLAGPPGPA